MTGILTRLYGRRAPPIGRPVRWPLSRELARWYAAPDGWTLQAFQLALDPTPEQWQAIRQR